MTKQQQNTLIVITFLIAVFFLGQWLWNNIPMYETQERIEFCKREYKEYLDEEGDGNAYYLRTCLYWAKYEVEDAVYCQQDREKVTCYVKERVRIQ